MVNFENAHHIRTKKKKSCSRSTVSAGILSMHARILLLTASVSLPTQFLLYTRVAMTKKSSIGLYSGKSVGFRHLDT